MYNETTYPIKGQRTVQDTQAGFWSFLFCLANGMQGGGKKFRLFLIHIKIFKVVSTFLPDCLAIFVFLKGGLGDR